MSEWGIGADIVEIARFRGLDYPSHKQFYERVFTPREIEYCLSFKSPAPHFAVNFAGKEAVYKAINRFYDVTLHDIEILRDENKVPRVNLRLNHNNETENESQETNLPFEIKVSLSHSSFFAVAFAVARNPLKLVGKHKSKRERVLPDEI